MSRWHYFQGWPGDRKCTSVQAKREIIKFIFCIKKSNVSLLMSNNHIYLSNKQEFEDFTDNFTSENRGGRASIIVQIIIYLAFILLDKDPLTK